MAPAPSLVGSNLTAGNTTYLLASRAVARKAYPWCRSSATTSYWLRPSARTVANDAKFTDYEFKMDEDWGLCKDTLTKKGKASDVPSLCATPFYSFMIAVSMECHQAIMSVNTVQMFAREDKANATQAEMYCHAHKGHDTGVPLLKYLIKPHYLTPSSAPGAKRRFVLTMRINKRTDNKCGDLMTLCGAASCMAALSDEEYDTCPAFVARMV